MENVSTVTSFIFTAYAELEDNRYLYFTFLLFLYILILFFNSVLILVICIERGLHEPMYLFLCNLSVNAIYGSTVAMPSILSRLLYQNYEISLTRCLIQIYCAYLYGVVEYTVLAVMAYDRYVAICHPLHYHLLMSHRKAYTAIALSWFIPGLFFALYFISTVRLSFCGRHIYNIFCSNFHLQTLSCTDTSVENFVGMALIAVCPGIPFFLILFSYAQILRICLFGSRESQIKALKTCTPHLVTVINFTAGVLFDLINSQFNMSQTLNKTRLFMSIYFPVFATMLNPVIYGMGIGAIRVRIFKLFRGNNNKSDPQNVMKK